MNLYTPSENSTTPIAITYILLCNDQSYQKWLGDDIGTIPKYCNDFYSTPIDQGLCQTKNINIHNPIEMSRKFQETLEANYDKKPLKIGLKFPV